MWIIPKPITSAFVPDTGALISDLDEQSHAFAQSLIQRSKVTPAPTWLRRLRQDSWTRLLSGRMLRASHTDSFTAAYTSSLVATLANHSQPLGSDLGETTPVTSGLGSQMELLSCDPACASSRTSKDTLPLGCVTCSTTWESWVTERRGAYSRRLKLALLTRGRESSSWPTPDTCSRGDGPSQSSRRTPTLQTQVKHWPTANSRDWKDSGATQGNRMSPNLGTVVHRSGQLDRKTPPRKWEPPRTVGHATLREDDGREPGDLGQTSGEGRCVDHALNGSGQAWGVGQTEPPLGRDPDGSSCGLDNGHLFTSTCNRTDELRLLGNGVVPATAALAFTTLLKELS